MNLLGMTEGVNANNPLGMKCLWSELAFLGNLVLKSRSTRLGTCHMTPDLGTMLEIKTDFISKVLFSSKYNGFRLEIDFYYHQPGL